MEGFSPKNLIRTERPAWDSFVAVVHGFLRNYKVQNYAELVETLVTYCGKMQDDSQSPYL